MPVRVAVLVTLLTAAGLASAASVDKAFAPSTIGTGGVTTLTFTVTNPAGQPARSDVGFTDTLPSGLVVANPASVGGTCANAAAATVATAGTGTITVVGLQVPAGASLCTVTVNVTNAAGKFNASCAGNPVAFTNGPSNLAVAGADTNAVTASCVVVDGPTVAKAFSPTTIAAGGTTTLTFTYANPAGAAAASNLGVVDSLPGGLVVANPANVGGTCANAAAATAATPGGSTITTTNLQVAAGASICTVTVDVTPASGQFNASCAGSPSGFTNGSGNLALTNVIDAVTPSCVAVLGGPVVVTNGVAVPTLDDVVLGMLALLVGFAGLRARRANENGRSRGRLRG
jgi:uncharacterized repeat protein (TIGR01451 family)